jgi:hypothetical protein
MNARPGLLRRSAAEAIGAFAYQLVRGERLPQPEPQTERA